MLVDKLREESDMLDKNVQFGLRILFLSNSRVSKNTIESLDSIIDKESIPIKEVALISTEPLRHNLESLFEMRKTKFTQFLWSYNNGDRDYTMLSAFTNYDVIVITSGRVAVTKSGTDINQSFENNKPIIKAIAQNLKGYKGAVILTTNPVDFMLNIFLDYSNLDPEQVIGLYSEGVRFRRLLADYFGVSDYSMKTIRSCVSSIHGASMLFYTSISVNTEHGRLTRFDLKEVENLFNKVKAWPKEVLSSGERTDRSSSSALLEYLHAINHPGETINASVYLSDEILKYMVGRIYDQSTHFMGWLAKVDIELNKQLSNKSPLFLVRFKAFPPDKISIYNHITDSEFDDFLESFKNSARIYSRLNH